jgi:NTE family protein
VGVLRVLEREGVPVDCIAGTSVGSVVGVACAAGFDSNRLQQMALEFRWRHAGRPVWPRDGFISFAPLESYLAGILGDLDFGELKMPYAAVATDLVSGEQVVLREGRVAPAVRASCTVPGLVVPVELDGRTLIDGGIVNNLPISVVRDLGADVVIAVGLSSPPGGRPKGPLGIGTAALEFLLINAGDDPSTADIHIPIPVWGVLSLVSTGKRHRYMALGRQAAERALPAIKALLE